MDVAVLALMIPFVALSIPIVYIIVAPFRDRVKQAERKDARQMYERIALEKLDVIKTAVAMGYSQDELTDLDSRLEQLIGREEMAGLLDKKAPSVPLTNEHLLDADLQGELERLKRSKQKQ